MKSYKKTRGAVSVFLVLILVPCLLVSSIFVDVSRVELAKGDAESAADTALNALLAHFDTDLNDWYGMVASCQNINEFYAKSKDYFITIVTSQDLTGSEDKSALGETLGGFYDSIIGTGGELTGETSDLLLMQCLSAEVSEVDGANLQNAALMKAEITEFMKYRAPIELATGLIERLENDSSAGEITEAEKNEPLVEKKKDYYEAEGELLSAAFKTYRALMRYYNKAEEYKFTRETPAKMLSDLEDYKEAYRQINNVLVRHLINTKNLKPYELLKMTDRMTFWKGQFQPGKDKFKRVYSYKETDEESGELVYYIDREKLHQLESNATRAAQSFEKRVTELVDAAKPLMDQKGQIGFADDKIDPVQWWKRMDDAIGTKADLVKETGEALIRALTQLEAAQKCVADDSVINDTTYGSWVNSDGEFKTSSSAPYGELLARLQKMYDKCLSGNRSYNAGSSDVFERYLATVVPYESICTENKTRITPDSEHPEDMIQVGNAKYTVRGAEEEIRKKMAEQLTQLMTSQENLTKIVYGDPDEIGNGSLDELKELAKRYRETFQAWKDEAYSSDTQMGADDRKEIEEGYTDENGVKHEALEFAEKINEEAVEELKKRLNNIHEQLEILSRVQFSEGWNDPSYMTYVNTPLASFMGVDKLLEKARSAMDKSGIENSANNQQLNAHAANMFKQHFTPKPEVEREVTKLKDTTTNAYNPDIDPKDPDYKAEETPYLFVYFYSMWKNIKEEQADEVDKKEQEREDAEKEQEKDVENKKEAACKYRGPDDHDIKKEYSGDSTYSPVSLIGAIGGFVSNLISGNFAGMRDELYLVTYMTKMFSCATYDREGAFHLLGEEKQKKLDGNNFPSYYKEVQGDAGQEKTWLSERYQDAYNKSLTGKMINEENNRAYLAEQEYILFGGTNESNVRDAFANIYLLRYTLNLVSCFQHFWSNQIIGYIAWLISAATYGIVPEAAIKVVLLLMYTAVETALDNLRLAYGFPVELYKKEANDWTINLDYTDDNSYGSFVTLLKKGTVSNKNNKGIFYSDYIAIFLYLGVQNGGKLQAAMIQRTGELIQSNLRQKGLEGFTMEKSKVYFNLKSKIRVKPLMISLPLFEGEAGDLEKSTDWCTFEVNMTRGYT